MVSHGREVDADGESADTVDKDGEEDDDCDKWGNADIDGDIDVDVCRGVDVDSWDDGNADGGINVNVDCWIVNGTGCRLTGDVFCSIHRWLDVDR